MKPRFTLFVTLLFILIANKYTMAQVGIGTTTPNASSILDLTTTSKGVLIPRMTAAQKTAISSPATGLLVYQTDGSNGFWYYDGTQWLYLSTSLSWALAGNAGTTDGTNFLGTTDDVPLTLKVNNVASGRIGNSTEDNTMFGYSAGINNTYSGSTFFGHNAGQGNTSGTGNCAFGWSALQANSTSFNNTAIGYASMQNTTGYDNTAVGENTLLANLGGIQNTALGSFSLYSNTVGNGNSAVGQNSMYSNTSGLYNSAVGVNVLYFCTSGGRNAASGYEALKSLTTGSYNTGFGYQAGYHITTGSNNTFLGNGADVGTSGNGALTNATAIGYNAVVKASNSLVLGSSASPVKVGIGVSTPTNDFSLDGTAARTIWMERNTNSGTAGFALTMQAGGAYSTGSNLAGGDLTLSSGTSTGTGTSNITFKTATAGGLGTSDNAPTTKMSISGTGVSVTGTMAVSSTMSVTGVATLSGGATVSGPVILPYRTTSAVQTLTGTDYVVENSGGACTWTLPTTNLSAGRVVVIINHGSGTLTISPAFNISSAGTANSITVGNVVQLMYDGSVWRRMN